MGTIRSIFAHAVRIAMEAARMQGSNVDIGSYILVGVAVVLALCLAHIVWLLTNAADLPALWVY